MSCLVEELRTNCYFKRGDSDSNATNGCRYVLRCITRVCKLFLKSHINVLVQ